MGRTKSHFQKQDHNYERVLKNTPKKQTEQKLLSSEHDTHEDTPLYTATAARCDRRLAKTVGTNLGFQTTPLRDKLQTSREDCPCTEATLVGVFVHVHVTASLSESVVLVARDLVGRHTQVCPTRWQHDAVPMLVGQVTDAKAP